MFTQPVTIVDIETTGGSARNNRIIEIAVLRVENGRIVQEFTSLVNPGSRIPPYITSITGITDNDVADAPYFEDIAAKLSMLFDGALFMAHHAIFDFSFVKRQMEGCGYSFKPRLLCSVKLSRALYPHHEGHSLEKIITRHHIRVSERHRAFDDAKAVYDFVTLAYAEHGGALFAEAVHKQLKLKSLPAHFDESQLQGIKNVPGVYIFKNADGSPVYIGKSVNIRNRVLSHFAQATTVSKELKISQNTHRLEVIETASELEALLLESKLIKEMLPVYNRKLRRKRKQTILTRHLNDNGYYEIKLVESNVSAMPKPDEIFGVFDNRFKAKEALQEAREMFGLCSKLLGLEKAKTTCFYHQLKKCKGACVGLENAGLYNLRLNLAFDRSRVASWKYGSPIMIPLESGNGLVVDQWKIIGRISEYATSLFDIEKINAAFDLDNYKILKSYISKNKHKIVKLDPHFAA